MTLWQSLIPALFGLPAAGVSLALAVAGLASKSPRTLFAAALFAVPLGLYTSASGGLFGLMLLPLGLFLAAPFLLRRDRARTAVFLVAPFFVTVATIEAMIALQ